MLEKTQIEILRKALINLMQRAEFAVSGAPAWSESIEATDVLAATVPVTAAPKSDISAGEYRFSVSTKTGFSTVWTGNITAGLIGKVADVLLDHDSSADKAVPAASRPQENELTNKQLSMVLAITRCGLSHESPSDAFVHQVRRLAKSLPHEDGTKFNELLAWHDNGREPSTVEVTPSVVNLQPGRPTTLLEGHISRPWD